MSWYKVFGYPTGIGSLVARREMLERLERPWFAGGTIGVASVALVRHTLAADEVGFEDGTIDYLGIPALSIGLRFVESVGIEAIGGRVRALTEDLLRRLSALRHGTDSPLVRLYGPVTTEARGGTIPFNLLGRDGQPIDFRRVEAAAAEHRILLRTGCFCNPGASETARGITAEDMARVFALGRQPTLEAIRGVIPDKALGAVRVSPGLATTAGTSTGSSGCSRASRPEHRSSRPASGGGVPRLDLDGRVVDAVPVEDGEVGVGIERLGREDPGTGPGALGQQLHRHDGVEARLPCHRLQAVAAMVSSASHIWYR